MIEEQIRIKAIYPTSYSNIKNFLQCPLKFYNEAHLAKYPFKETDEIRYGNRMHKAAELYIRDGKELPEEFSYLKTTLDALNRKPGNKFTEIKLGIMENFVPCGFFNDSVWIRGVIDLLIVDAPKKLGWVFDYKSGLKTQYADTDQLELMALLTFASYPEVECINAGLVFPRVNQLIKAKYKKEDKALLWSKWVKRHNQMMQAHKLDKWATRESGLCKRHCPVTDCIHNGANQ